MNSRERIAIALDRREPDRIPIDFWASTGFKQKIKNELGLSFEEFQDQHDVDLRFIEGPAYIGPSLESDQPDVSMDIWGVPRRTVSLECGAATEYYQEVTDSPLKAETVAEVEAYSHWPSPDWFDYSIIKAQCEAVHAKDRVTVFMGDRLNRIAQLKPAMYLCGVDTIMMNMGVYQDAARAVFKHISDFYLEYTRRILEAADGGIDIVCSGDDFGAQTGLLISPGMWDSFIREGFKSYIDLIHQFEAKVMHHTCGAIEPLIGALTDCGLDILQSVQPEASGMNYSDLKSRYGERLCFQGGISIQKTMPFGTAEDVRREVRALAETLGKGGGYIFGTAHNIQADTSIENVEALLAAYKEYGRY